MKNKNKIFVGLLAIFLFGVVNFANAANCPGTCRGTCADDERTMAWFSGLRFDNCGVTQACCVKDAAGGNCPGTCRSGSCPDDEYSVGWTGYKDCSGFSQSCCMKAAPSDKPTTNTGVGSTTPATANPTTGASPTAPGAAGAGGAGSGAGGSSGATFSTRTGSTGGLVPCTDDCTLCHLVLGFKNIYDYLLMLLLSATMLVVVVAGIMYMVSSGNKGMIDKAKSALTYALTAMILGLLAWLIINATLSALGYTKVGSWYNFTCDTEQTKGPTTMGGGGATLPGNTGAGGGAGSYQPNGNLNPTVQKVLKNYMTMDGWSYGERTNGSGDCWSTPSRAYTLSGLPDLDHLNWQVYNGDRNSIQPGDVMWGFKNGESIHSWLVFDNGATSSAIPGKGIGINPDGWNANLSGKYDKIKIAHIADYIK